MDIRKKEIYNKISTEVKGRNKKVEYFSHSKIDTFNQCKLQYKYKYIDKIKSEFEDNIYNVVGTLSHDLIEKYVTTDISRDDLLKEYIQQSNSACVRFDLENTFSLVKSMKHFFTHSNFLETLKSNHKRYEFEVPVYSRIKDTKEKEYWYVGFIDIVQHNDDGTVTLYDLKTSHRSGYSGQKLEKASIQLYVYSYLYELMYKKKVKEIKYVFLKFSNIKFLDSKGKNRKTSNIERSKIEDDMLSKDGVKLLECEDNFIELDASSEIKLSYMKKFLNDFVDIINPKTDFTCNNRDEGFCIKLCEYRKSGHCKAYAEKDNTSWQVLQGIINYSLNKK